MKDVPNRLLMADETKVNRKSLEGKIWGKKNAMSIGLCGARVPL
jgi:hypothetical protein